MKVFYKGLIVAIVVLVSFCALSFTTFATDECEHTGGQATCTKKAVCELCGEEYGELDSLNHSYADFLYVPNEEDPSLHDIKLWCCGVYLRSQEHALDDQNPPTCIKMGSCYYCKIDYIDTLPHNFSEASCTYPKTCLTCDTKEGELLPHKGGEAGCITLANCEVCGVEYGDVLGHIGGNATCTTQAVCQRCNMPYGVLIPHTGGVPTCQSPAICTVCNSKYGELGDHTVEEEWSKNKIFHYNACANEGCTDVYNDADHTDSDNNGKCDICEYKYKLGKGDIAWIIVGSVLGALVVIGVVVAIVIVTKKKRAK